ncbi:LysR family transcriptional regulator [Pseudogracilibacillus sp. SO30301A]|uniref:LysR family transcriptional regulator n=1 Tax=Pseudogracilibacillus sp. SO30301A TaxID=3098291 RepID=UPI00300E6C5F
MHIRDWELLHTLYETQNITHASEQLYLSQSTLSSRLKKLEEDFGLQIVIRKRRGISFTPEGIVIVKHAQKMLNEQEKLKEKLNNMKNMVTGTLKVGVSNFFARYKMPKLLSLFQREHPGIECKVVTGWSSEMYRMVLNREVHIGFIKGDYPWKESREILYEENVCVAAPWPFEWDQLPSLPRIDYHTDRIMKNTINNWWYTHYKEDPYTNIYVNQVETCKEMILNKLGYGILAQLVVDPYKELTIKPLFDSAGKPLTRNTSMYYYTDALQLNIVEAFISFVLTLNMKQL